MTPDQLKAIRARFDSGLSLEYEQVDSLLNEVERLTHNFVQVNRHSEILEGSVKNLEAKVKKLTTERDEAEKLAYIGDHHFPDLTWKFRHEETCAEVKRLQLENGKYLSVLWAAEVMKNDFERLQAENERLKKALDSSGKSE